MVFYTDTMDTILEILKIDLFLTENRHYVFIYLLLWGLGFSFFAEYLTDIKKVRNCDGRNQGRNLPACIVLQ